MACQRQSALGRAGEGHGRQLPPGYFDGPLAGAEVFWVGVQKLDKIDEKRGASNCPIYLVDTDR